MTATRADAVRHAEVVVVGTGVAGLAAALGSSPRAVTVLTKTRLGEGGSSAWAQGGVAAAVGDDDAPRLHAADTLAVSGGLGDPDVVGLLTSEGPARIGDLIALGTRFDRESVPAALRSPEEPAQPASRSEVLSSTKGARSDLPLALGREAAHSRRRILHAGGDATGAELVRALTANLRRASGVTVLEDVFALDLAVETAPDGRPRRVVGVLTEDRAGRRTLHLAGAVVLATGGLGQLYRHTTNPAEITGDGLAMAARAGAGCVDLEFVQFHPTALAAGAADGPLPLLTEALRGEGAVLLDDAGRRFMVDEHPDAELAPRDVVARAIHRRRAVGGEVLLDARRAVGERFPVRFPTVFEKALAAGLDPRREPLPVTPAAHYHMGGVETDDRGGTTLPGLWACGETACTGAHGANRLASNSLLEALVFGARVAADLGGRLAPLPGGGEGYLRRLRVAGREVAAPSREETSSSPTPVHSGGGPVGKHCGPGPPRSPEEPAQPASRRARSALRSLLTTHAGLERTATGLRTALADLDTLERALPTEPPPGADRFHHHETRNLLLAARLVVTAALARPESRGAHFRLDHPAEDPAWRRRLRLTLEAGGDVRVAGAPPAEEPAAATAVRRAAR